MHFGENRIQRSVPDPLPVYAPVPESKERHVVQFVAEVSSNHHRDLDRCKAFIRCASEIGADAVKFQLFKIEKLFAPEILERSEKHRLRAAWELPAAFLPELARFAQARQIAFACTPFDLDAVEQLRPFVSFFKISSYDLLRDDLLRACASLGKPVVLSTGMATLSEVTHAVTTCQQAGCAQPTLLHCNSSYPTAPEQANLSAITALRRETGLSVGWSDHSASPAVIYRAVHAFDATMVEFHLDLDQTGPEYPLGHCWKPETIGRVIREIRQGFQADGWGHKRPAEAERTERMWRADPADGLRPIKSLRPTWHP